MFQKTKRFFSKADNLVKLNATLILLAVLANSLIQVFCVPTLWASLLLLVCFTNVVAYPVLMKQKRFTFLCAFLNGISVCIFIYCIIFLDFMNLYALFLSLVFIGLMVLVPPFFVIQLLVTNLLKQKSRIIRISFLSGILAFMGVACVFSVQYKQAIEAVKESKRTGYQSLEKTFMTEKIVGMHFKYHTRVCEYDGWRPPLHEPALIIGRWFCDQPDPINLNIVERIALYKKFFPDEPVKVNCSCAMMYGDEYLEDKRLK